MAGSGGELEGFTSQGVAQVSRPVLNCMPLSLVRSVARSFAQGAHMAVLACRSSTGASIEPQASLVGAGIRLWPLAWFGG